MKKMISRHDFLKVAGISAAALGLAACGGQTATSTASGTAGSEGQSAPEVTLIGAHVNSDDSSFNIGMVAFAEALEEVSGGKMTMEVHGNGELGGDETELVQKVATGTVDVVVTSPGFLSASVSEMDLFTLPFLYSDIDHWKSVVTGEPGETMAQILQEKSDFKILSYFMCGIRNIFSTKEIRTMDDLNGIKMRLQGSESVLAVWSALGVQPASLAYNELYSGLQNKVIDAAENDLGNILLQKFYEAGPYIALSEHDIATRMLVISNTKYNSLTDEQKAWVDEAAQIAGEKQWEYDVQLNEEARVKIEANGGQIIEIEDRDRWVETATPLMEQAAENLGVTEIYNQIVELR